MRPLALALVRPLVLATVLCLTVGSSTLAQSASPAATASPFCALLTPADVTGVLGLEVTIGESLEDYCSYDASNGYTSLTIQLEEGPLADMKPYFPDAVDTTVAGRPAMTVLRGTALYVTTEGGYLALQLLGYGGSAEDATAALVALAPTALDRLESPEVPGSSPAALPSFAADADLAAQFPKTIAGQPIEVQTFTARQLADQGVDAATVQAITDGLAAVGKTLDDMSLGFSSYAGGDLSAIRVSGVDAGTIQQQLMPLAVGDMADPQQTPTTIAGKAVIKVTDGPDSAAAGATYFYAHDDVLWVIAATEPDLTEILQALP